MEVSSAVRFINDNIAYKPGWSIAAKDHCARFEESILVQIEYPARNSDMELAPEYPVEITARAEFVFIVNECDDVSLVRQIADAIMKIEEHEMREFLRVKPTFWAPFNPHRVDGMKRWNPATVNNDLYFGVATG